MVRQLCGKTATLQDRHCESGEAICSCIRTLYEIASFLAMTWFPIEARVKDGSDSSGGKPTAGGTTARTCSGQPDPQGHAIIILGKFRMV